VPARSARIEAVDRIKACAIVIVVAIHSGPATWQAGYTSVDYWLRAWMIWAVPAFIVVAGHLARTHAAMPWAVFRARMTRILIPYGLVASLWYAIGYVAWPGLRGAARELALGSTIGIYYFLPVMLLCLVLGAVVSRLPHWAAWAILAGCLVYLVAIAVTPALGPAPSLFWGTRDPLVQFWFGFFLLGWLRIPERLAAAIPPWGLLLGILASCAVMLAMRAYGTRFADGPARIVFATFMVAGLWRARFRFPGMEAFSETTLGVYLLHYPITALLYSHAIQWHPVPRMLAVASAAYLLTLGLCLVARLLLGPARARFYLGA
jgi:surface polysaccharide O-acyltransferase-like enzyme